MSDLRQAAEQALKTFEKIHEGCGYVKEENLSKESNSLATLVRKDCIPQIEALRQALAHEALDRMVAENQRLGLYDDKPPVKTYAGGKPNYCTPVDNVYMSEKRVHKTEKSVHEWVGLTRRELDIATLGLEDLGDCYLAIEAKLKEKNAKNFY